MYKHQIKCPDSDGCSVKGCRMEEPSLPALASGLSYCCLISMAGCRELETPPWFLLQGGCIRYLCKPRQQRTRPSLLEIAGASLHTPPHPCSQGRERWELAPPEGWCVGTINEKSCSLTAYSCAHSALGLLYLIVSGIRGFFLNRAKVWRSLKRSLFNPEKAS